MTVGDFIVPQPVSNFHGTWESLGSVNQAVETFALSSQKSLKSAVETVIDFLSMEPVERSGVVPQDKKTHSMMLSGRTATGHDVFATARFALEGSTGVALELTVRSDDESLNNLIANSIS